MALGEVPSPLAVLALTLSTSKVLRGRPLFSAGQRRLGSSLELLRLPITEPNPVVVEATELLIDPVPGTHFDQCLPCAVEGFDPQHGAPQAVPCNNFQPDAVRNTQRYQHPPRLPTRRDNPQGGHRDPRYQRPQVEAKCDPVLPITDGTSVRPADPTERFLHPCHRDPISSALLLTQQSCIDVCSYRRSTTSCSATGHELTAVASGRSNWCDALGAAMVAAVACLASGRQEAEPTGRSRGPSGP